MKIVIAMDSFKGSLSALEAAIAVGTGLKRARKKVELQTIELPLADGGEGTVEALVDATGGEIVHTVVTGPLGNKVKAFYGILGDKKTAVIEMAAASGLPLVPIEKRNPLITTTYGTGELIKEALNKGCREFIIGIGGSATNDGGAGMAQALGARLLDEAGEEIPFGGGFLGKLYKIDISNLDVRLKMSNITVACDVENTLCGNKGASAIYGPQKGATPQMVRQLDEALGHYATVVERDLQKQIINIKGSGAAGGLGGGCIAFLNATLKPGIDIIIEKIQLREHIKEVDLVITGEGKIDSQTAFGKTPIGVAKVAKEYQIPVIALAAAIADDANILHEYGIDAMFSIMNYPITLEEAMDKGTASKLVENTAEQIFRLISIFSR